MTNRYCTGMVQVQYLPVPVPVLQIMIDANITGHECDRKRYY
jgi:hypothetical protein